MKQKFFLALLTFGLLFVIFSIKANSASAATLGAEFKNQEGFIGLTVTYRFYNSGVPTAWATAYVEAGSVQTRFTTVGVASNPSVEWYTDCADPTTNLEQWTGTFWGVSLKVHAENPCGEPVITSISCPTPGNTLTFSWQMTGRAAGLPYNVANYALFFAESTNQSVIDNNYWTSVPSTQTSASRGSLLPGHTYGVRVSAVPPAVPPNDAPNDEGWSDPRQGGYSSTTCQSSSAPGPPTTQAPQNVPACSDTLYGGSSDNGGNAPNINHTWTIPANTTNISWQFFKNGTLIGSGSGALYTAFHAWNLSPNTLYPWRVSAGNATGWSSWADGSSYNVPKCTNPPPMPINLSMTPSVSCTDTTYSATFNWTLGSGTTRGDFELRNWQTNTLIVSRSWSSAVTSTSYSPLTPGVYYEMRVRAGNSSLQYSDWGTKVLDRIPTCSKPDLIVSALTTDKTNYLPGGTVSVTVSFKNQGWVVTGTDPFNVIGHDTETSDMNNMPTCSTNIISYTDRNWQASMAAGQTITYTYSFTAPNTPNTYKIVAVADQACFVDEGANGENNNRKVITFSVASLPTNPSNLSVFKTCNPADSSPIILFNWDDSASETGYYLDVNNAAWTGPGLPSPWGYKALGTNAEQFIWSPTTRLDSGSVLAPAPGTTYWWRVVAFNGAGQSSHMYDKSPNPDSATPPGTPFTVPNCKPDLDIASFNVPSGSPSSTVNATVTVKNVGDGYTINGFRLEIWNDIATAVPIICKNRGNAFILFGSLAPGASSTLSTSLTLPSTPNSYTALAVADIDCAIEESDEIDNAASDDYTASGFDLSASFDSFDRSPPSYQAGQTATVTINVKNNGNTNSPATTLGLWPKGWTAGSPKPTCPSPPGAGSAPTPPDSYSAQVPIIPAGGTQPIQVSFLVGNDAITSTNGVSYVVPNCEVADYKWDNNITIEFSYTVRVDAWFETTSGDVGSGGAISVSLSPPPRPQSGYLLARANSDASVSSRWRIDNYTKPLVAADPYAYMAERFRQKASNQTCTIPAGKTTGYNYCTGDAVFDVGNAPNGNSVFFIDGNLTIKRNLELTNSQYTAIFIVKGNITVETDVTRIDGVYIAGGTFSTTDSAGGVSGSQLVINGAVYGANVNLSRKLSSTATCAGGVTPCTNATQPAEKIVYDPQ